MFESNQLNILRRRFSRLHLPQPSLGNALGRSTHCPGRIETQTASHYVDRYSKNHREEQVASWPQAGFSASDSLDWLLEILAMLKLLGRVRFICAARY
jgi:hypothetical protein